MVFSPSRLHDYVIHIVFQLMVQHVVEYGGYRALVSCTCILQPKGHHSVVEITYKHFEGNFLRIFWCHSNLVLPTEPVHEGKYGIPYCRVYH